MKLSEIKLDGTGILAPGKRGMMQAPSKSGFKSKEGFDIDYDPASGLVTIAKDGDETSFHIHRCLHVKRLKEEDVVVPIKEQGPPPQPPSKILKPGMGRGE